jgi:hypothetical protein
MSQTKEELRWALIGASDIAKTRMINAINSQPNSLGALKSTKSGRRIPVQKLTGTREKR